MTDGIGELLGLDATAQAELVRKGEVKPSELVEASIERVEEVNPALNAVIHKRYESARSEAGGSLPDGPFRGVPLLLKDLGAGQAGEPIHFGTRAIKAAGYRAEHNSFLTDRFLAAGFVVIGRTNVPEFGTTITTESLAYGPAHNPWNLDHSTGGSSGGSAAAVAAFCTPVAHANDGGGSIRIPASECGLVGLKPSRGRVTHGPDVGESWMGSTIDHAVTRSVRDSAAVLDCIAGYAVGDPYTAPPPAQPFAASAAGGSRPLRIGLLDHSVLGRGLHEDCAAAVRSAGALLERLGHHVTDEYPEAMADIEFQGHFIQIVASCLAADLNELSALIGRPIADDELEATNALFASMGRQVTAPTYLASVSWLHRFTRRLSSWWVDHDVLVTPVLGGPPPPLGWLADEAQGLDRVLELIQFTPEFNVSGQPAISLPLATSSEGGLPIGVQLVAAYGREDILLALASDIEAAAPWADRRPAI